MRIRYKTTIVFTLSDIDRALNHYLLTFIVFLKSKISINRIIILRDYADD